MAIFATHVVLMRNFEAVVFAPGDELPEWAAGQVGAHCLEADMETVPADVEPVSEGTEAEAEDVEPVSEGTEAEAEDADAEPVKPKAADAPDFTSAAPRRGRPRK